MKMLNRLRELEKAKNSMAALVLDVVDRPTSEQQSEIDMAIKCGRRLLVFFDPGNTL